MTEKNLLRDLFLGAVTKAADASVFFSFDRTGYKLHAQRFREDDLAVDLAGKRFLVTGANAGLGRATALALADLGADVWLLCRDRRKGETARDEIRLATGNEAVHLAVVDVASRASILAFAKSWDEQPIHGLIHNAGLLLDAWQETPDGIERTFATHVVGPFLLTAQLLPGLKKAGGSGGARVIWVTSGGMYLKKLQVEDPIWLNRRFDGVAAYAETKRAQVVLAELWAERLRGTGVTVNVMHPGWADTAGVRNALPGFSKMMGRRLRDSRQGADTIVWLAACERIADVTSGFFFDRRKVSTHVFPWTRETEEERAMLWEMVTEMAGLETVE